MTKPKKPVRSQQKSFLGSSNAFLCSVYKRLEWMNSVFNSVCFRLKCLGKKIITFKIIWFDFRGSRVARRRRRCRRRTFKRRDRFKKLKLRPIIFFNLRAHSFTFFSFENVIMQKIITTNYVNRIPTLGIPFLCLGKMFNHYRA